MKNNHQFSMLATFTILKIFQAQINVMLQKELG